MKIKFLKDCEYEVTVDFDEETDAPTTETDVFHKDEEILVELLLNDGNFIDIQFGDGSVLYGLHTDDFVEIDGNEMETA